MRCERARELLSDYFEGTVGAAMQIPLESHLRECAECRAEADGLRVVWRILDKAPVIEPPVDFRATVWRKIDAAESAAERRPRFDLAAAWRRLWTRPALAWSAAALVVLALSSIAVPGTRHIASLGIPWLSARSRPDSQVTIGAPVVTGNGAAPTLSVQVTNHGATDQSVTVRVLDGIAERGRKTVMAPAHSTNVYDLMPLQPGDDATKLRVEQLPSSN